MKYILFYATCGGKSGRYEGSLKFNIFIECKELLRFRLAAVRDLYEAQSIKSIMTVLETSPSADPTTLLKSLVDKSTHETILTETLSLSCPTGLFINNSFVPSVSGKKFETINPRTGKTITSVYEADKQDVLIAVEAAKKALAGWKRVTPGDRSNILFKLSTLVERDARILAELESLDNGKSVSDALYIDVAAVAGCIRFYAGFADKVCHYQHQVYGKTMDCNPDWLSYTVHEPFGITGAIIPWNFPLLMVYWF